METKKLLTWGAVILVVYLIYTWYKKTQATTASATPAVQTYYADGTPVIPGLTQAQNEGN